MGQPTSGLSQHVGKTQMWASDSNVYFQDRGFGEYTFKLTYLSRFLIYFLKGYFYYKNINFFSPRVEKGSLYFLSNKQWKNKQHRENYTFNKQKTLNEVLTFKEEWDEVENKAVEFKVMRRRNYIEDLIWAETRCLKVGELLVVVLRAVNGLAKRKKLLRGRDPLTRSYVPLLKKTRTPGLKKWF